MAKDHKPEQPQHQIINDEDDDNDDLLSEAFSSRSRCCACLPCFGSGSTPTRSALVGSSSSPSVWERLQQTAESDNKWWNGPVKGLKKVREWSEIVAGPKWKTFIRRFNRKGSSGRSGSSKFNYDPLSYALNFDDGPGHNGHSPQDYSHFPDFSSRYASVPLSCKSSSTDLAKNAIPIPA